PARRPRSRGRGRAGRHRPGTRPPRRSARRPGPARRAVAGCRSRPARERRARGSGPDRRSRAAARLRRAERASAGAWPDPTASLASVKPRSVAVLFVGLVFAVRDLVAHPVVGDLAPVAADERLVATTGDLVR